MHSIYPSLNHNTDIKDFKRIGKGWEWKVAANYPAFSRISYVCLIDTIILYYCAMLIQIQILQI